MPLLHWEQSSCCFQNSLSSPVKQSFTRRLSLQTSHLCWSETMPGVWPGKDMKIKNASLKDLLTYAGIARREDEGGHVFIYAPTFPASLMQILSFCVAHNMQSCKVHLSAFCCSLQRAKADILFQANVGREK